MQPRNQSRLTGLVPNLVSGSAYAAALVAVIAGGPAPAAAQGTPAASTIIVFDGSNSMNNKLPGDTALKHVAMREAIRAALPRLGPGTQVGLASFGHRRPADCTDAEVIQPPTADTTKIMAPLEKFQPKGYSPVVLALRAAAKALPSGGTKASLIIVLDDLASCRGEDPCKVAGELKKDNPALAIHVVGLALKPADAQVMACVAQQTGGRLFDAQDGKAAAAAVEQALQLASAEPAPAAVVKSGPTQPVPGPSAGKTAEKAVAPAAPAVAPAKSAAPPVEQLGPGLHLTARLSAARTLLEQSVRWRITRDNAAASEPAVAEASQPRLSLQLPNGRYVVEAQAGLVTVSQPIEVTGPGPMPVAIQLNAGVLSLSAPLSKGGEPSRRALLSLFQATPGAARSGGVAAGTATNGRPLWLAHAGADDLVVPAGSYRIVAEDGLSRAEQTVTVAAGTRQEVELALGAGRLVVDATMSGTDPLTDNVQFIVEEDDPDGPNGKKEILRTAAPRLELTLPAGSYQVTARLGAAESRERVSVRAGEDTSRSIALAVGRVRLASRLASAMPAGVPVIYRIERLDGPPRVITRGGETEPVIDLSPGRYRMTARIGAQNAVAEREVEVKGGFEHRIDLSANAGGIRLKLAAPAAGSLGFGEVFWQIMDERGLAVWRTSQLDPQLVLAPGRYSVTVELRERSFERAFEVKNGDNRVLEIGG